MVQEKGSDLNPGPGTYTLPSVFKNKWSLNKFFDNEPTYNKNYKT